VHFTCMLVPAPIAHPPVLKPALLPRTRLPRTRPAKSSHPCPPLSAPAARPLESREHLFYNSLGASGPPPAPPDLLGHLAHARPRLARIARQGGASPAGTPGRGRALVPARRVRNATEGAEGARRTRRWIYHRDKEPTPRSAAFAPLQHCAGASTRRWMTSTTSIARLRPADCLPVILTSALSARVQIPPTRTIP
jgi:hypothetical protein